MFDTCRKIPKESGVGAGPCACPRVRCAPDGGRPQGAAPTKYAPRRGSLTATQWMKKAVTAMYLPL